MILFEFDEVQGDTSKVENHLNNVSDLSDNLQVN